MATTGDKEQADKEQALHTQADEAGASRSAREVDAVSTEGGATCTPRVGGSVPASDSNQTADSSPQLLGT